MPANLKESFTETGSHESLTRAMSFEADSPEPKGRTHHSCSSCLALSVIISPTLVQGEFASCFIQPAWLARAYMLVRHHFCEVRSQTGRGAHAQASVICAGSLPVDISERDLEEEVRLHSKGLCPLA